MLAEHPIVMRVGDTVFVHGGVLRKHVAYGIDKMNGEVRDWMLGRRPSVPDIVGAEDGPVWSRLYSNSADLAADVCAELGDVLASLGAKRMVVGHTVQTHGITSACQERVWRIDVGMSRFFGGTVQVLDIVGDQPRVRRGELENATAPPP